MKKGKMFWEKFEMILLFVMGVLIYEDFKSVDVVIEVFGGGICVGGLVCDCWYFVYLVLYELVSLLVVF